MSYALNRVRNRLFPIPPSAQKCLEREAKPTDFTIIKYISSNIYLFQHNGTKSLYIVKALDKRKIEFNQENEHLLKQEIENIYKLYHKNIVKIYGHFEDNYYCYILIEHLPFGNIRELLPIDNKKRLKTKLCSIIIRDVISAVYYLHNMNPPIIHKNINLENVRLLNVNEAKLTYYSWKKYIKDDKIIRVKMKHLPPEIMNGKSYDEAADLWNIGILLFQMVANKDPFDISDYNTYKENIMKLKINWPKAINNDAKDLIEKILKIEPKERLSLEKMMVHPFIIKYAPDAEKYLIKPVEGLKFEPFVILKDDPKKWVPKK